MKTKSETKETDPEDRRQKRYAVTDQKLNTPQHVSNSPASNNGVRANISNNKLPSKKLVTPRGVYISIQECLEALRKTWRIGTCTDFESRIAELTGCTLEEAEKLRTKWEDEDLLAYDPEGLLVWLNR